MSGDAIKLKEVSDFVTPSQRCVLPLSKTKSEDNKPDNLVGIKIKSRKKMNIEKTTIKLALEDCLACSGCVTTSELEW